MDQLSQLRVFAAVVDGGSFTAAADQLDLSRPSVSKMVAALEEQLGVRLLNRTTRRVAVTEAGRAFHLRCEDILDRFDNAVAEASQLQVAPRGELRINASLSFGRAHLVAAVADFQAQFPEVRIDLVLNDRFVDIVDEGFDVAVRIGRLRDSSLVARGLAPCRLIVCAAPSYLAAHGEPQTPDDLPAHNCLKYSYLVDGTGWRFAKDGETVTANIAGDFRANSGEAVVAAAVAGRGVILEPTFLVAPLIESGALVPVLVGYAPPELGIHAVYPKQRLLPRKVRVFIDFLVARYAGEPYWDRDLVKRGLLTR
ncbi:MAG: LysR family transcriptional regulator [Pseudomonadota bacterium]